MKPYEENRQAGFTLIEFIVGLVVAAIMASMFYAYFGSALTQSSAPIARLQSASNLQQVMENIVADYNRLNALNLRYKWRAGIYYPLNCIVMPSDSLNNNTSKIVSNGFYYKCTVAGTSGNTLFTWPTTTDQTVSDGAVTWKAMREGNVEVWQANHTYSSGTIVVPTLNNGHYYRCTTGGTSHATNAPTKTAWLPATVPSTPWTVTDNTVTWTEAGTILESSYVTDNLTTQLGTAGRYGTGYTVVSGETKFVQFNGITEVNAGVSGTSPEKNILKVTIKNNDNTQTLIELFTIR